LRVQRPAGPRGAAPGATLFVVCFATALLLLNVSAPNVALGDISADIGADFTDTQLIVSLYALAIASLLVTAGSLADLHGRKRVFLAGVALFGLGSLGCAVSPDPTTLITVRFVQGAGAAVILSSGLSLIAQEFEGRARARALGIWGATVSGAYAVGPLEGGLLTDSLGWRWLFWVNVLLCVVVLVLGLARLRESSDPTASGVDWLGVATFSPALGALVFALVRGNALGWTSPTIVALFAAAAVLLIAFCVLQRRRADPMLDLDLFRVPTFTGSAIVTLALAISSFAPLLYVTLYLLQVVDSSPPLAGLQLAPLAGIAFVVSVLAGRHAARLPLRASLCIGMLLCAAGLLLMRAADTDSSGLALAPGLAVCGLGIGIATPFVTLATLGTVPTSRSGTAAGMNNTFRQLGIAGGIAALGAVLQSTITSHMTDRLAGTPAGDGRAAALAEQSGDGDLAGAAASLPAGARSALSAAYDQAFVLALHDVLLISAGLAVAGAVAALTLVRQRDFLVSH
jgi:EmrB/QacA subfamily drug resistance transporter